MSLDPAIHCEHDVVRAYCWDHAMAAAQAAGLVFPQHDPVLPWDDGASLLPFTGPTPLRQIRTR